MIPFPKKWHGFICNRKGWVESYVAEKQRERERVLLQKGCSAGNKMDSWNKYL